VGGAGIQLQPTARGLGWRQAQPSEMFLDVVFLQDFETLFGDSVMVLELGSANFRLLNRSLEILGKKHLDTVGALGEISNFSVE
jgi:hypothetical protein